MGERHRERPRPLPRRRVLERHRPFDGIGRGSLEALDHLHVLARALRRRLGAEIRGLDDERVAVPRADGVALPQTHAVGEMRTSVERNAAPRHAFVEDDEIAGRLENVQRRGHIHRPGHTGDEAVRRWVVVAALGKLTALHLGLRPRLHRQIPVRRIDDERRALVGGDLQSTRVHPVLVVGTVDIGGIAAVAPIARQIVGERGLELLGFLVAQHTFLPDVGWPFERRARGVVPHALEIRITPRRLGRRVFLRRRSGLGPLSRGGHDQTDDGSQCQPDDRE